jgi:lysophospholipase L1-like esterase
MLRLCPPIDLPTRNALMRPLSLSLLLAAAWLAPAARADDPPPPFELKDGDRVVLIGNTLIEREQRYGYWELALTARYPDKNITFRNLGWSGDTVWAEARAGFGTPADGFKKLKEGVHGLKPTVLIVGYGGNEAFAGAAGLPRFEKGLNDLLDAVTPTGCRVILLAPLKQEDLGRPLPDPTAHNKDLALYRDKIREVAEKRKATFVDLFDLPGTGVTGQPLTDDGLHLTAFGYLYTAPRLVRELVRRTDLGRLVDTLELGKKTVIGPMSLPAPVGSPTRHIVMAAGLPQGRYTLFVDAQPVVTANAEEWAKGMAVAAGPEFDQVEKLRQAIVEKNRLYFHRWRPQNETYLFLFRKNEQGQNAREIPLFDPLVEEQEKAIAKLRVPVEHTYELKKEAGK